MQIDRPITIAVILFIILLLVFFLVMPEFKTFRLLQADLGQKRAEFIAEFDYYAAVSRTFSDLRNHQEDIKKVDDALPQDPSFGPLIYFLQQVAKENGLTVKNLFLSKTAKSNIETDVSEGVKDIVFSMDLLGDYTSLNRFVVSLEKSSRIFEVTSISFGASSGALSKSYSLQIKTHSY